MAALAAVFTDDLEFAVCIECLANLELTEHLEHLLRAFDRTPAIEADGFRIEDADIVLGKQLAQEFDARRTIEIVKR